jgi:putative endonuclease
MEHEAGKVAATRYRRPVKLVGYEAYILKTDASRREKYMKTTEGKYLFRQQYRDVIQLFE